MNRRIFLMSAGSALAASAAPRPRNNVLFIASDDLNHCFSAYGHPLVRTPHLDEIARRGVRFDRAYCQFALCSPSRTSLMTGLAPDKTGVYNLQKHFRETVPDAVTLGQLFQKNGYFSGRVGKIYHYGNPGQIGTDGLDDAPTWNKRVNPKGVDKTEEEPRIINHTPGRGLGSAVCFYASPRPDEEHTDGMVAAESIRMMEEQGQNPWFIGAGFYRPHCPYVAPAKYFDRIPIQQVPLIPVAEGEMNLAPKWAYFTNPANWGMSEQQRREGIQAYFASILFLDAKVGKLLDALDRLRMRERTTIVFWSDHGYGLGEHGQWMKQTIFEYATRAPLMLCGAGVRARGRASGRVVEFLDIYPTLADLCGLEGAPRGLHGRSLRPLLGNPNARWDHPAVSQMQRGRVMGYSLRTARHRYSMWHGGREGEELYDYQTDPRELRNLAAGGGEAPLRTALRSRLESILAARRL